MRHGEGWGEVRPRAALPYTEAMNLALIADWLTTSGGAERALAEFHAMWPESPIFTTVRGAKMLPGLRDAEIRTSRLQPLYRIVRHHQLLLPLMPRAVEDLDLRGFDVIVSSSHAVGKGIIPPSNALHICYCHTPMRYAWEMEDQYLDDFKIPRLLRTFVKRQLRELRRWDLGTAKRVDAFIANSSETAARIARIYGRNSVVIPPPVQDRFFATPLIPPDKRGQFLAVGRLVPYKRFDLLIECANREKLPLTIVGKGHEWKRLHAMAGATVSFRDDVSDEELPKLYASAKAVLFPTYEDAGIVPLEAQACGTPVIAYGKGGTLDTIVPDVTGLFFDEQSVASLTDAIARLEQLRFEPEQLRRHAQGFSSTGFKEKIAGEVEAARKKFARS